MIRIPINEYTDTNIKDVYIPAPCRGIVVALKGAFSEDVAEDDTVDVQRDTTSVNLLTVALADIGEGIVSTGVPDATNHELIFDPNSSTAAHKVIHVVISALVGTTTFNGYIDFDNFAITEQ